MTSTSQPFPIELAVARLRTEIPVADLLQIRGVAEFAAIKGLQGFKPPEAFVANVREDGVPNDGASRQVCQARFGVVIAARNYKGEQLGDQALASAGPLIGSVRDALIGWTPAISGGRPCAWVQGYLLDYDAATVLWAEVFQTQMFIGRRT